MNSVTFKITEDEIIAVANRNLINNLSNEQTEKVLSMVENDSVLWSDIDKSIQSAINFVSGNSEVSV
jgi:ribosomal protein S13